MSIEVRQYVDDAISFCAKPSGFGLGRPLRVARTLLTCASAAAVLNELGAPAESESAYAYINVHNPRCPLFFDAETARWACRAAFRDHPVWGINWAGANMICRYLGGRLPLRQEWECFASNNDPTRKYPWGDAPPSQLLANFGEHFGGTTRVGSFPPSELGLYDLAGNLDEWCYDAHETPFERVVKGGAWSKDACHLEIAASRRKWERLGTTTIGFRTVWDD